MKLEKCFTRFKSHHFAAFFLIALATTVFYLTGENGTILEGESSQKQHQIVKNKEERKARNGSILNCDLFSGRWVFDNLSYPLYKERECSFLVHDFACEKYGRKDLRYQNWKWQPHDCDLPRFNGTAFLGKIRGKKLVFVGDSLNRNQWVSLLCLIESSVHQSSPKKVIREGNLFIFQAIEYNATIGFYWSPFLVESNADDPFSHQIKDRIIRITSIEKHARHWTNADILIFDTFMWWVEPTMTILWGSFGSNEAIYKRVKMKFRRYEMTLNTWSDWLEININRMKTKIFFMSLSPYHFQWDGLHHCYNESEPMLKDNDWGSVPTYTEMMHVAESVIKKLERRGLKIEYLNITHLSDCRRDAHPSIYWRYSHDPPTEDQLATNPKRYSDGVHWCLPGVPDIWNEILYSYII
ncbi:hypothetical protein CDL12_23242 [Handroanthus impetiginosus]|uniref:Uncharacterized protein n=1 Tax=Handroanthus impetiginosus TaxID=429701 RepID=A0A2G9GGA0_9LAMI|nr:hypothetical protein CDL12_23242 [Handroanthus impetiginosus]